MCFVLLAARRHLPPFAGWKPPLDAGAWNAAAPADPWAFDGYNWAPMMRTRVGKAADGPKPLAEVGRFFQSRPDVLAVRAVAFPVRPAPRN